MNKVRKEKQDYHSRLEVNRRAAKLLVKGHLTQLDLEKKNTVDFVKFESFIVVTKMNKKNSTLTFDP